MEKSKLYNIIITLLIILSFIFYFYYFINTKNQALWWDEAEYMLKAKSIAVGTPDTGFWEGRPIMFSVILAGLLKIGFSEVSIKFLIILTAILTIGLVYLFGKYLFNEKIGLIAAGFYAAFYLNVFYSMRIMVDVPHLAMGIMGILFFLSGKKNLVWLSLPLIALATLIRFPSFLFAIILVLYIFATEGISWIKKKDYWISATLGILIFLPYFIWSKIKFGSALHAINIAGSGALEGITLSSALIILKQYIFTFPLYIGIILSVIFAVQFISIFINTSLSFDLIIKRKSPELNKHLLLLLSVIVPLIYFSFRVSHYEDRYLLIAFPAIFCCIALGISKIYQMLVKKMNIRIALAIVILIIIIGAFQLLKHSSDITLLSKDSYRPIKESSIWLKEHSKENDSFITKSVPQTTYYSERRTYSFPNNKDDFAGIISEIRPRYIIISVFEKYPQWAYSTDFPLVYNLTLVKVFEINNQPALVIYELKI